MGALLLGGRLVLESFGVVVGSRNLPVRPNSPNLTREKEEKEALVAFPCRRGNR